MKKIIVFPVFLFIIINLSVAQIKTREAGNFYASAGYSFIFFTNSDVTNIYPILDFRRNSMLSELDLEAGFQFNKNIAIAFNPGLIYSNSSPKDGFYFRSNGTNNFYFPNTASLFAAPINAKIKLFPFANNKSVFADGFFFGLSAGAMYIYEQYDNTIYDNNGLNRNVIGFKTVSENYFKPDMMISTGFDAKGSFGFGFELGYRFVPLKTGSTVPVITSVASNFNSVNLMVKIGFRFY